MGAVASEITSLTIVYSTVYSGADQRKHQSSASLAFVRGIHRWPVSSPHKWPVTRKMFPFDDDIMTYLQYVQMWRWQRNRMWLFLIAITLSDQNCMSIRFWNVQSQSATGNTFWRKHIFYELDREKQSSNILCQVINYGFVLKIHRSIVSDLGSKQCCDWEDSRDCVEHFISINFGSWLSKNIEHRLQTQVAFLSFILEKRATYMDALTW